jgi:hypothetical protein
MAVSVEVVYEKSGWKLVRADFAIADKWMESRKAVREFITLNLPALLRRVRAKGGTGCYCYLLRWSEMVSRSLVPVLF